MPRATLSRRELVATGLVTAGALAFGPRFWREVLAAPAQRGPGPYGPYGPLEAPDANGPRLPAGFRSREIARANQLVPGTAYPWHVFPDGQAVFGTQDGGWILVSNSESLASTCAASRARARTADSRSSTSMFPARPARSRAQATRRRPPRRATRSTSDLRAGGGRSGAHRAQCRSSESATLRLAPS